MEIVDKIIQIIPYIFSLLFFVFGYIAGKHKFDLKLKIKADEVSTLKSDLSKLENENYELKKQLGTKKEAVIISLVPK